MRLRARLLIRRPLGQYAILERCSSRGKFMNLSAVPQGSAAVTIRGRNHTNAVHAANWRNHLGTYDPG